MGVAFLHVVYRYNLTYVYDSQVDTRGLVYPKALMQLLLGLYFSEICMAGLFSLRGAYVQAVLTAALLVVTASIHSSLLEALGPLLWSLPKSLTAEEDQPLMENQPGTFHTPAFEDLEDFGPQDSFGKDSSEQRDRGGDSRALEGGSGALSALGGGLKSMISKKIKEDLPQVTDGLNALDKFWLRWLSPDPTQKSNFLLRWLHPEVFSDYTILRRMIPPDLPDPVYPEDLERDIYYPPSFLAKPPTLWIPRDPAGVSRQEVDHCAKIIPTTDEYVSIDEDGHMTIDLEESRLLFDVERLRY